jgi:hypothetical protein
MLGNKKETIDERATNTHTKRKTRLLHFTCRKRPSRVLERSCCFYVEPVLSYSCPNLRLPNAPSHLTATTPFLFSLSQCLFC